MTRAIFYDLETSDLNLVGQILTYAFVEVDSDWTVRSSLVGKVRLSRLQIPSIGALLTNKINLTEHQGSVKDTEREAALKIGTYLSTLGKGRFDPIPLIGFNSTQFDLHYLRTTLIRNGVNPYPRGIGNKDVRHVLQHLCFNRPDVFQKVENLKLETVTRYFGLLEGPQKHEALFDVELTIKLAKFLADEFGVDVRTYSSYEPNDTDVVVERLFLDYSSASGEYKIRVPGERPLHPTQKSSAICSLLLENKTQSLWVDLDAYQAGKGRDSVFWVNKNTGFFAVGQRFDKKNPPSDELCDLALQAREEFKNINFNNFFPPKNCDIEQFIYTLNFDEQALLSEAIQSEDPSGIKKAGSKNASVLYLRYQLANAGHLEGKLIDIFKSYVLYRYGGRLKLSKNHFDVEFKEGIYSDLFHKTYNELLEEASEAAITVQGSDREIIQAFSDYINESDIRKYCDEELSQIWRVRVDQNS